MGALGMDNDWGRQPPTPAYMPPSAWPSAKRERDRRVMSGMISPYEGGTQRRGDVTYIVREADRQQGLTESMSTNSTASPRMMRRRNSESLDEHREPNRG